MLEPVFAVRRLEGKDGGQGVEKSRGGGAKPNKKTGRLSQGRRFWRSHRKFILNLWDYI